MKHAVYISRRRAQSAINWLPAYRNPVVVRKGFEMYSIEWDAAKGGRELVSSNLIQTVASAIFAAESDT